MTKKILIISIFILFQNYSFSQNNQIIDSLQTLLKTAKDDTNKVKLLIYISGEFSESNAVEAFKYNNQCLELISKLSHQKNSSYINEWLQLAACDIYALFVFTNLSVFHDPKKAMEYILKGLAISKKLTKSSDKKTANEGLHRLARSYFQMGNIFIGLEIDSSLKYYSKALPILLKIDDKELLSRVYEALASINIQKGNNEKGLEYMNSALVLAEYLQDKRNKAILYTNMGDVYLNEATTKKSKSSFYYTKCLEYYFKALKEASDDNNKKMQSAVLLNIALAYTEEKQFTLAKEYGLKSLALSKEINSKINSAEIYKYLSHIYAKSNDYKNAYMNHLAFSRINDSLTKIKITSSVSDVEIKYKKEKKNEEEVLLFKMKQSVSNAESKKQKIIIVFIAFGLLFSIVFAGFIFRSLRNRNKQNKIITEQKEIVEHQKHLVEEKNREITDSIEYALRIQTAILPPQKIVKQYLENSFILYKPKDIVAGDFYWMETINDLVLFAACDCTGHGVPGAMVSVVCHNALNRAVREFGLTQPAAILDKTAEIVLENFAKSEEEIQDGMDISICALNTKTRLLEWAGANNPLWLIGNGILIETKADKQCIGHNDNIKPFTNHKFKLESDTSIYLFSDGFADQFGGQPERKLTKNRFKELLLSIQHLPIQQQATELDSFITNYKKEIEQTDDILVIGVQV